MESIKVTILGKQYPLKVAEDEIENMQQIARFVDEKFRLYRQELSKQPETTIMVLAALSIAEELFATRRKTSENRTDENAVLAHVNDHLDKLLNEF
ncbi:MAG: cell division protein ZapA [Balneolaceae bacterium]